jgi:hypothetical protein
MESLPVLPELRNQIQFELGQLRQLLSESREIIEACRREEPSGANRWALGAVLHAFYNGIENILKRISAFYDGKPEKTGQWHIDLLTRMALAMMEYANGSMPGAIYMHRWALKS